MADTASLLAIPLLKMNDFAVVRSEFDIKTYQSPPIYFIVEECAYRIRRGMSMKSYIIANLR